MTWEIVTGIIALIGVGGTVATWTSKLAKTIATLETTVDALNRTLTELQNDNKESHKNFYAKLENHEGRITHLEEHLQP